MEASVYKVSMDMALCRCVSATIYHQWKHGLDLSNLTLNNNNRDKCRNGMRVWTVPCYLPLGFWMYTYTLCMHLVFVVLQSVVFIATKLFGCLLKSLLTLGKHLFNMAHPRNTDVNIRTLNAQTNAICAVSEYKPPLCQNCFLLVFGC